MQPILNPCINILLWGFFFVFWFWLKEGEFEEQIVDTSAVCFGWLWRFSLFCAWLGRGLCLLGTRRCFVARGFSLSKCFRGYPYLGDTLMWWSRLLCADCAVGGVLICSGWFWTPFPLLLLWLLRCPSPPVDRIV
jgi:hypothetical protein